MRREIYTLLHSRYPEDRKEAIKMLVAQGDGEALRHLAMLYKYDTDPEIQRLALQAGKLLKRLQGSNLTSATTTQEVRAVYAAQPDIVDGEEEDKEDAAPPVPRKPVGSTPVPPPVLSEPDYYVPVSTFDLQRSYGYIEAAQLLYDQVKFKQAIENLRRALNVNPNLRYDDSFIQTAAYIAEKPDDEVIAFLLDEPAKTTQEIEALDNQNIIQRIGNLFKRGKK